MTTCALCGTGAFDDLGRFVVDKLNIREGSRWTTGKFPPFDVGAVIEAHEDCAALWSLPLADVQSAGPGRIEKRERGGIEPTPGLADFGRTDTE